MLGFCSQDFLMIGAGPKPDIDTLYTFTGSVLPDSITIDSSQAWMRFFSDESNENAGFQLMYGATQGKNTAFRMRVVNLRICKDFKRQYYYYLIIITMTRAS